MAVHLVVVQQSEAKARRLFADVCQMLRSDLGNSWTKAINPQGTPEVSSPTN